MQFTLRMADSESAERYPLDIDCEIQWRNIADQTYLAQIDLPSIPAHHILIPSLCIEMAPSCSFQFSWQFAEQTSESVIELHLVPNTPASKAHGKDTTSTSAAVTAHIDCWHTKEEVPTSRITLELHSALPPQNRPGLLTLTARPLEIEQLELPSAIECAVDGLSVYSQKLAEPAIRNRICSPTALTMCLSNQTSHQTEAPVWNDTVQACYDPHTKAYGSWLYAIRCAARSGRIGAVEAFSDWHKAAAILRRGLPLVCSIRWETGTLSGAPMSRSSGHLVVLRGISCERKAALVLDPAAETIDAVPREYPLEEFSRAWLAYRGAAYVIGPPNTV